MSKLKVLFILCMVVLFAVVAVFPNLGHARAFPGSRLNGASHVTSIEVLIADGGDPVPPPMPLPRLA
jgi:hypothetical protein